MGVTSSSVHSPGTTLRRACRFPGPKYVIYMGVVYVLYTWCIHGIYIIHGYIHVNIHGINML